ncbi:tail protein X [Escherichia coli]|uniref:tail protein X n=1 Tax=Escherichia coli TaxID=562 RepID=UPI000A19DFF5|nr:tail protein X [Escherichia coli]
MYVTASDGDTLDLLCWRHYGTTQHITEQVLIANPGLCEKGPRLPAGTRVRLPDITPVATATLIQLWD